MTEPVVVEFVRVSAVARTNWPLIVFLTGLVLVVTSLLIANEYLKPITIRPPRKWLRRKEPTAYHSEPERQATLAGRLYVAAAGVGGILMLVGGILMLW